MVRKTDSDELLLERRPEGGRRERERTQTGGRRGSSEWSEGSGAEVAAYVEGEWQQRPQLGGRKIDWE